MKNLDKNPEGQVRVALFATLRRFAPGGSDEILIAPGMRIADLLARLSIPEGEAKLIFVDGVKADRETVLKGGERVGIFPPLGGG